MKKLYVFAMLLVVVAMLVSAFAPQELSQLYVWNKVVGEDVNIKLDGIRYGVGYYLTAPGPSHKMIKAATNTGGETPNSASWRARYTFDIRKDLYDVTIYLCGLKRSGTINLVHDVRLIFPSCYGVNANVGEPTIEKVDLFSSYPGACNEQGVKQTWPGDGVSPYQCNDFDVIKNGDQIWWRLDWFNWWNGGNDILEPFAP